MPSNEKRFGFSLLSKLNFKKAYKEEVMIDKFTGDVAIKTPFGDTISYNYVTKFSEHMNVAREDANRLGIYGSVYNVPFVNKILPLAMDKHNANLYEPVMIRGNINRFMLHIDITSVAIVIDNFSIDRYYGLATFGIKFHYGDGTVSDIFIKNIATNKLNEVIFDLTTTNDFNLNINKELLGIELTQFDITSNYDTNGNPANNVEVRHILNSLFIITEV